MTRDPNPTAPAAEVPYAALFAALPSNSILVRIDPPVFTIVAATPGYAAITGYTGKPLLGMPFFEAFPANADDPAGSGDRDLLASFRYVQQHRAAHFLPTQRYDLRNDDGSFTEKYWKASNSPISGPGGELAYILHTAEDITSQVTAEKREVQLDGIENIFGLFMHAPIVVGLVNGDDYVLEMANNAAYRLWGKGPEMIGKPILQTLPELEGQGIIELFDAVRASGEPFYRHEVPVTSLADGTEKRHYFNIVYQPYYAGGSPRPTGVFTISHDVTEQVLARQRLEESETKFRTMAESTPVLIAVGDASSNATYFNRAWSLLTGRPMEQLLEFGWVDLVHPEDKERYVGLYLDAFAVKAPFTGEFRVLNPAGEYRWLFAHGAPRFHPDGSFAGYISSCTDITEHKISQQQLQTALEQARLSKEAAELGTFDMDPQSDYMHWDDRCRTLFGISHHNGVSYEKDFLARLHPDDKERVSGVITKLFDPSVSNGDYDIEYRTIGAEDGVLRWVRAKGKVYFNTAGQAVRFIGSVLDITEQKTALQRVEHLVEERTKALAAANDSLLRTNRELQRSNQNLEEFAHAASHDLKEPVRKIHFFTNLLKEQLQGQLQEGQERAFGRIEHATKRMGGLIDDLLLYSHASQRPIETERIDLNKKVHSVLGDLELDIEQKGATVRVGALPEVKGYRRQLQQLFQNLVSNALKYSKRDVPPVIDITADRVSEDGIAYHRIAVRDNGIGFEPEYADKIFQMFARLHGKGEYSGTGVGLSIVKKVLENHNGFIRAESTPGEGSTFLVFLPVE